MAINADGIWWFVLMVVLLILPLWKITSKAGFPGALSFLILIPVANIVFLYVLAFAEWPALRALKDQVQMR